jgi:hypothetical protein
MIHFSPQMKILWLMNAKIWADVTEEKGPGPLEWIGLRRWKAYWSAPTLWNAFG